MGNSKDTERITSALQEAHEQLPDLRFAYVFGSVATGAARDDSDIDIAADFGRRASFAELATLAELVGADASREVDVVDLRATGPVLHMQVLRNGVVVFERDPKARALFEMHTPSMYEDFQREREPVVRAILEGYRE